MTTKDTTFNITIHHDTTTATWAMGTVDINAMNVHWYVPYDEDVIYIDGHPYPWDDNTPMDAVLTCAAVRMFMSPAA